MQLPIAGYDTLYEVSADGKVWSIKKQQWLTPIVVKDGVLKVSLSKDGSKKKCTVHKLVAEAFLPNPDNKPQIDHIDGNKHNNSVDNLRWCTNAENQAYREAQGNDGSKDKGKTVTWGEEVFPSIRAAAKHISALRGSKEETVRKELKAARYGSKKLYGEIVCIA